MHPGIASSPGHSQLLMLHVTLKAESGLGTRLSWQTVDLCLLQTAEYSSTAI